MKYVVKKGIFIVIEGLDGSGKTTQAAILAEKFFKTYNVLLTAEPSSGKIGNFIRECYLYENERTHENNSIRNTHWARLND